MASFKNSVQDCKLIGTMQDNQSKVMRRLTAIENIDSVIYAWTMLFLVTGFFTPLSFSALNGIPFFLVLLLLVARKERYTKGKRFSRLLVFSSISYVFAISIVLIASPYSKSSLLSNALFLATTIVLFTYAEIKEDEKITRAFYVICSIVLTVTYAIFILFPAVFIEMVGPTTSALNYAPLLLGEPDKNWTGVFIFLYLCLSIKKKWYYGIFLGCCYPLLYFGRQYLMMAALLFVCLFILKQLKKRQAGNTVKKQEQPKPLAYFFVFVVTTVIVIAGSFYWADNVVGENTASYKSTLNDDSNAIRTLSNVYAVKLIASDSSFFIYGYDSDVFVQLGISPDNTSPDENVLIEGLWRLVVPHEEVINMLLKEGALVTLTYYLLVSIVLARVASSRKDYCILVAYFAGSMLLSSMFKDEYLLLLCIVLFVSCKQVKSNRVPIIGSVRNHKFATKDRRQ